MKFKEAEALISQLPINQTILLAGPPGIGKSTLAESVAKNDRIRFAKEMMARDKAAKTEGYETRELSDYVELVNSYVKVCDLACYLPEDLLGVPYKELVDILHKVQNGQNEYKSTNITRHAPPLWMTELSVHDRPGLLLLDDIGAASKSVQVSAFRLVQERAAGDLKLSENVRIICTTNRRQDKSGASTLPAALVNRMLIMQVDPDVEEWTNWYTKKGYPSAIASFLLYRPVHLSHLPKDADERGSFATPRSWEKLARCLQTTNLSPDDLFPVAEGLIGNGVAVEFIAFLKTVKALPNPAQVLNDPVGCFPSPIREPDKLVAIVSGLAEYAAKQKDKTVPLKFMKALAHICSAAYEYAGTAVTTYVNHEGSLPDLIQSVRGNKKDKKLKGLMVQLRKALDPDNND